MRLEELLEESLSIEEATHRFIYEIGQKYRYIQPSDPRQVLVECAWVIRYQTTQPDVAGSLFRTTMTSIFMGLGVPALAGVLNNNRNEEDGYIVKRFSTFHAIDRNLAFQLEVVTPLKGLVMILLVLGGGYGLIVTVSSLVHILYAAYFQPNIPLFDNTVLYIDLMLMLAARRNEKSEVE